eukprot:gnl/TRDRNA2_/TRDRNA2_84572_c0_seq1.p1 gnl/TRDRNA2_/TRDRNA2_84572_c0~~gnl/TRDRNA2_/TRDRNA2_84572_c0_seq1.p1  ORF type:complete len:154 (-),score=28.81 gnl/TRDRNA2_/TRDRNA2_84572_c0_seq1:75-536(-)
MARMLQSLVLVAALLSMADALHPAAKRRAEMALGTETAAAAGDVSDPGDEVSFLQSGLAVNTAAARKGQRDDDEVSFLGTPLTSAPAIADDSENGDEVSLLQLQSGLDAHLHVIQDSQGDAFVGITPPTQSWTASWKSPLKTLLGFGRNSDEV